MVFFGIKITPRFCEGVILNESDYSSPDSLEVKSDK